MLTISSGLHNPDGGVPVGCGQAQVDHRRVLVRGGHIFFVGLPVLLLSLKVKQKLRHPVTCRYPYSCSSEGEEIPRIPLIFWFFHPQQGPSSSANADTVLPGSSECPKD